VVGILNDINNFLYNHSRIGSFTFWAISIIGGGIVGIFPDTDHVPQYVLNLPIPGRILHPIMFIIGCYGIARFGRLYINVILKEIKNNNHNHQT
jgi:hypothetical protein